MKMLTTIVLAGTLSVTAGFAESIARDDAAAKQTTPQLPFRPYQKRPAGTATTSSLAVPATVATPALPFRPYQKRPMGSPSKPVKVEASNRIN